MTLKESRERWWAKQLQQNEGQLLLEVRALGKQIAEHAERVERMIARGRRRRLGPSPQERTDDALLALLRALTRSMKKF
jgi:hypothetical protein